MISIDPIRPYLDFIKIAAVIGVLVAVYGVGYAMGSNKWQGKFDTEAAEHVATKASHKAVVDNLAALTKQAEDKAKSASNAVKRDQAQAAKQLKEATDEAKRNARDLRAALRSGKQQLSDTWACPASAGASDAAAGASEARTEGQYDSAARITEAVESDAAVIEYLWNGWMADRKAVIDAGCAVEAKP